MGEGLHLSFQLSFAHGDTIRVPKHIRRVYAMKEHSA